MESPDQVESVASPHPQSGRGQFLPRLSYGQQGLAGLLLDRGIETTVTPLYYLRDNPELSLVPSGRPVGTVLDPCTQIRRKPWAERPTAFRALGFGNDPEPYDPESARLTDEEILRVAIEPLDLARSSGGTLLLSTFHGAGPVGTRGRTLELLFAELGIAHFRNEGMAEPPPFAAVGVPRELYATIAIHVTDLMSPSSRAALADAYLALEADGLWVKIEGFHERASTDRVRAGGAFLSALREGGGSIVSCGSGQLHLGLLADDIPASIGLAESERFRIPSTWPKKSKENGGRGRTRMAYHPKFHRSFRVGSEDADKAFSAAPCECDLHAAGEPPAGLVVAQHAAILRADQAREALDGERADRREWLFASSTKASWAAADAGIPPEKASALRSYEALFAGLDAGLDTAIGEQAEF